MSGQISYHISLGINNPGMAAAQLLFFCRKFHHLESRWKVAMVPEGVVEDLYLKLGGKKHHSINDGQDLVTLHTSLI